MYEDGPQAPRAIVLDVTSAAAVCVGSLAEIFGVGDRAVLRVERDGAEAEDLLLLRLRHGLFAIVNRCPHRGRVLDDGRVHGHSLQCRGHSRSYSLRTGRPSGTMAWGGPPKLHRIPAWAADGQLYLDLSSLTPA